MKGSLSARRALALLLVLVLLPLTALAKDNRLDDPTPEATAPVETALPEETTPPDQTPSETAEPGLLPGVIPSQQEDPHPEGGPTEPTPETTGHFDPRPTVAPEAYGYDLEAVLGSLPESLSATQRQQVRVLLQNMLNLKEELERALDDAQRSVAEGDLAASWDALKYYANIFEPMFPELPGVRFVCYANAVESRLPLEADGDLCVEMPVDLADVYYLLGYIAQESGRGKQALGMLEQAMAYAPNRSAVLYEYAYALIAAERLEEAEPISRRGLACSLTREQLARGYRDMGYQAVEAGKLDVAAALYLVSMEFSEDDQTAEGELDYIAKQKPEAVQGILPEDYVAWVADQELPYGLSQAAQEAMTRYQNSPVQDDAADAILAEWGMSKP